MKPSDLITTFWTYSRWGLQYLSFPSSIFSVALLIQLAYKIPTWEVLSLGVPLALILTILLGAFHFRTKPYARDTEIGVENSPYTYRVQPGLGTEFQMPMQIAIIEALQDLAITQRSHDKLEQWKLVCKELQKGKKIGEIIVS